MLIKSEYKPRMLPKEEQVKKPMTSNGRISFVLMAMAVLFACLIARGLYLQTVTYNFLKEQGDNRIVRTQALPATRGTVSDRNGAVLALSAPTESLFAVPKDMKEMPSAAQLERLSELVDVPVDVLRNKLEQKGKSFIWIKRQLDPKVAEEVKALGLENFVFEKD